LVLDQENEELKQKHALLFNPRQTSQAKKAWNLRNGNLSVKRLQLLLETIGLTKERGYDDIEDVQAFVRLRNDAVHIETSDIPLERVDKSFRQALQWLEEVLLWRLGYAGRYADRTSYFSTSTKPRYDCDLRNPNWD